MIAQLSLATAGLVAALAIGPALAQEQVFRTVKVTPGKQQRLGLVGNVSKDCKPGAMPVVKVVTPPKSGTLAVRSGKAPAGSLKRCPSLEVPAQGVFYQPNANFSGTDGVVYEVKKPDGATQVITIRIEAGAAASPGAKPDAKPDAKSDDAVDL